VISLDTNILFFSLNQDAPSHERAATFVREIAARSDIVISELSLIELYRLLRNPTVLAKPLSAPEAVATVSTYRLHPYWKLTGFPEIASAAIHDALWHIAATPGIAYRRIYDIRLALTLRHFGVTDFVTANPKDFEGLGFRRVWNPLADSAR
jgi:uncharacterized protein